MRQTTAGRKIESMLQSLQWLGVILNELGHKIKSKVVICIGMGSLLMS